MGQISEAKLGLVRSLIEQAPDAAIRSLLMALSVDGSHDAGLTRVQDLVETEAGDRRTRNMALSPITPLCRAPTTFGGLTFAPRTLALIWKALREEADDDLAASAFTLAVASAGNVRFQTQRAFTREEMDAILQKL